MSSYLYTYNPKKSNWSDIQVAIYSINNYEPYSIRWSCGTTKKILEGDLFFLMQVGVEPKGIIGCGYVLSSPFSSPHWDAEKASQGKTALFSDILFKNLSESPIITIDYLQKHFPTFNWLPQNSGISIPDKISSKLFNKIQKDPSTSFIPENNAELNAFHEGKVKNITTQTYDRCPGARQACIDAYGYDCCICGFNFYEIYGELGKGYVEVHHLKPISDIRKEYKIDPEKDLRPVCANCHRMLHKRRPPISIKEMKRLIK